MPSDGRGISDYQFYNYKIKAFSKLKQIKQIKLKQIKAFSKLKQIKQIKLKQIKAFSKLKS